MSSTPSPQTPEPSAGGSGVSLLDLVSGVTARYLRDASEDLREITNLTGDVHVRVTVHVEEGRATKSRGSVAVERNRYYGGRR